MNEIEFLYNVTPLQHEIITTAITTRLRSEKHFCDKRFHIVDLGEYEDGEHFSVITCKHRFEVVFDLNRDKVISIDRLDESRPDGP